MGQGVHQPFLGNKRTTKKKILPLQKNNNILKISKKTKDNNLNKTKATQKYNKI